MKEYFLLTKPGIVLGNTLTAFGGFLLAAHGRVLHVQLISTLFGLFLLMGSACVFNNLVDRTIDAKMMRTRKRALVSGNIEPRAAFFFAMHLGWFGVLMLAWHAHLLALGLGLCGFCLYVLLYTPVKHRSPFGIHIGGFAGAMPPVVGYCACSHRLDEGALLLFAMLFCWQIPHFLSLAILHVRDYAAASIPVFPVCRGIKATKKQMLVYALLFFFVAPLLTLFGYTGMLYFIVSLVLGGGWIVLSVKGFRVKNDRPWAHTMFLYSLIVIVMLSITMAFNVS